MSKLFVSEVFGPTVQGEGPHTGRRCGFVRLGLCNLACTWCDTPYTWDWTRYDKAAEVHTTDVDAVAAQVLAMGVHTVVITGGEPLIQRTQLAHLVKAMHGAGVEVEVETNGTLMPDVLGDMVDWWNVSPKLANSGMTRDQAWKPHVLRQLAGTSCAAFKFVCTTTADLDEVAELAGLAGLAAEDIWIMPEGRATRVLENRLPALAEAAIAAGYNVTSRLQVVLWGDTRGH